MNRVVKTTIASALVLSMALSGTTAAMAAAPAEEENCISAASIANWAENTRIKLFNIYTLAPPFRGIKVQIFYNLKIHTFFKSVLLNTPFDPGSEITTYTERFMQCACADNARFISANNAR
mgnify:CR=1 FL=1